MGQIKLINQLQNTTMIPNAFIDQFMIKANGTFVKIYLYLIRHASEGIQTDQIADVMECTESDILRSLRYWEKEGLLSLGFTESDELYNISILSLTGAECAATAEVSSKQFPKQEEPVMKEDSTISSEKVITLPERHNYSPVQAEALQNDQEIKDALCIVETMMGTTLSQPHIQLILYLMSDLGFSSDLLIFLYETSLSKEKRAPRYIETIALNWAQKGIQTVEQAEAEAANYNTTFSIVTKNLGITRNLAEPERIIINGWDQYHFSPTLLTEACKRTILQTNEPSLKYTSTILESWHKNGVQTMQDVERLDKSFLMKKQASSKPKSKSGFQDFPQRSYTDSEYSTLERQLLRK